MEKTSKIFIAGHTGLVGSAILRRLQREGFSRLVVNDIKSIDLRRQEQTDAFFKAEHPDYVFLAAAKVGGILANNTYKAEFIYDNIMIAANVINAAYRNGVKKLLNLGSSCIYPKFAPQPMTEESLLTGVLESTNEPYAVAKIAAIKLCRYYNEQYGTDFISVMPTNLYGPGDNFNLETAHVLPTMIRKFHLAKLLHNNDAERIKADIKRFPLGFGVDAQGPASLKDVIAILEKLGIFREHVLIWGTGTPLREFLFVDDLADACFYLMQNCNAHTIGEFVNIGVGKDISIQDLAVLVKEIVGFEGAIKNDTAKPDGTPKKLLNVSRLNALGWQARTKLKEGIKKSYAWYCEQIDTLR
ncbi:MAG: GDP-L-fucose synthase [Candidatus Omnitrophica bacterium]|nr:GDP-L-fucose synthase [Candidatus Omnitrophota bacterium]